MVGAQIEWINHPTRSCAMFRTSTLALIVLAAGGLSANAVEPLQLDPRAACEADIKQYCASVAPGDGRIVKCLRDNEARLSPACKDARAAMRGRIERKNDQK